MQCLRCGVELQDIGCEEIQLGHHSFLFGDLSNLLSGSLAVRIFRCPSCGKLELYSADEDKTFSERVKENK